MAAIRVVGQWPLICLCFAPREGHVRNNNFPLGTVSGAWAAKKGELAKRLLVLQLARIIKVISQLN